VLSTDSRKFLRHFPVFFPLLADPDPRRARPPSKFQANNYKKNRDLGGSRFLYHNVTTRRSYSGGRDGGPANLICSKTWANQIFEQRPFEDVYSF
jgi:hypothetical protein